MYPYINVFNADCKILQEKNGRCKYELEQIITYIKKGIDNLIGGKGNEWKVQGGGEDNRKIVRKLTRNVREEKRRKKDFLGSEQEKKG